MFQDLIRKYIADKNISVAIFAAMARIDPQSVYNWYKGGVKMRRSVAIRIEKATKGELTFEQLMGYKRKIRSTALKGTQLEFPSLN